MRLARNARPVVRPRPGHADLAGALKYDLDDIRDVLERASARETAARVAVGAVARQLLATVGIEVASHVLSIGGAGMPESSAVPFERIRGIGDRSSVRCVDPAAEAAMIAAIDAARANGDTVGGAFEVVARGVPVGLGSHVHWDRKLDGRLAQAVMSIHAVKAVAIGEGVEGAHRPGSRVHDEIVMRESADGMAEIARPTNRAGGLEGGITTGEEVRVTGYMKPISTLMKPLRSVDLHGARGGARRHRAQRRVRRSRGRGRRRSHGGDRPRPGAAGAVRGRFHPPAPCCTRQQRLNASPAACDAAHAGRRARAPA